MRISFSFFRILHLVRVRFQDAFIKNKNKKGVEESKALSSLHISMKRFSICFTYFLGPIAEGDGSLLVHPSEILGEILGCLQFTRMNVYNTYVCMLMCMYIFMSVNLDACMYVIICMQMYADVADFADAADVADINICMQIFCIYFTERCACACAFF